MSCTRLSCTRDTTVDMILYERPHLNILLQEEYDQLMQSLRDADEASDTDSLFFNDIQEVPEELPF